MAPVPEPAEMGIRTVWEMDLPDISGTHLHPADMTAAIVSIDSSRALWDLALGRPRVDREDRERGPGPARRGDAGRERPRGDRGPLGRRARRPGGRRRGTQLLMGGSRVAFEQAADVASEGLTEIAVELPDGLPGGASEVEIGGVRLRDAAS